MDALISNLQDALVAAMMPLDAVATQSRPLSGEGKPIAARWTVQQIMEHLLLTYQATNDAFVVRLAKDKPTRTKPTVLQRGLQFLLLRMEFFPPGRAAPAIVVPRNGAEPQAGLALVSRSGQLLVHFDELSDQAERRFGNAQAITHPVLGPMSASQWRKFHWVHGKHHLKQIASIRSAHNL